MSEEKKPIDATIDATIDPPIDAPPARKKRGPGRACKLGEKINDIEHLAAKARARYDRAAQREKEKQISHKGGKGLQQVKIEIRKKMIIDLVGEKSLPLNEALKVAGFTHQCYRNWTLQDEEFARNMAYAELKLQIELVDCIKKAAHTDWKAASYLLNHFPTYKNSFADPTKMNNQPTVNIQVNNVEKQQNAVLTLLHQLNPSLSLSNTKVLDVDIDKDKPNE